MAWEIESYRPLQKSSDDEGEYRQKLDLAPYSGIDGEDDYLPEKTNSNIIEKASPTSRLKEVATLFTRCATGAKAVLDIGSEVERVTGDKNVKMASKLACFFGGALAMIGGTASVLLAGINTLLIGLTRVMGLALGEKAADILNNGVQIALGVITAPLYCIAFGIASCGESIMNAAASKAQVPLDTTISDHARRTWQETLPVFTETASFFKRDVSVQASQIKNIVSSEESVMLDAQPKRDSLDEDGSEPENI